MFRTPCNFVLRNVHILYKQNDLKQNFLTKDHDQRTAEEGAGKKLFGHFEHFRLVFINLQNKERLMLFSN